MNKTIWTLLLLTALSSACEKKEDPAPDAPAVDTTMTSEGTTDISTSGSESASVTEETTGASDSDSAVVSAPSPVVEEVAEHAVVETQPEDSKTLGAVAEQDVKTSESTESNPKTDSPA